MTRVSIPASAAVATALAVFGLSAAAFGASPYRPSDAQKQAEYACLGQGLKPGSQLWELCLSHVTRAYDWDDSALALQLAHAVTGARSTCRNSGLLPESTDYRACVDREVQAQSLLQVLGDESESDSINLAEVH